MYNKEKIEYIDHTGDVGVRITARSLEGLFVLAARAMFNIIYADGKISAETEKTVQCSADDLEQLMVEWLSELNYLHQTGRFLLSDVPMIDIQDQTLRAKVVGETINNEKHIIHTEIKAATFHKIFVRQNSGGIWKTQIIFDI